MTTKLGPNIRKCNTDNAGVVTVQKSTKCRLGVCQSSHKGLVRVLSDRSDQEEQVRGHLVFIFSFNNVSILGP